MKFGMVLREVKKLNAKGKEVISTERIKTREGEQIKLIELLDEAKNRQLDNFHKRFAKDKQQLSLNPDQRTKYHVKS